MKKIIAVVIGIAIIAIAVILIGNHSIVTRS